MKLIKPYTEILTQLDGEQILKQIEVAARTCYKSEEHIKDGSAEKLVSNLIKLKHEAMLEFADITVKFVCDRGVSHELVRHRMASYAQESTRYCNYSKDKFDNELTFIVPSWFTEFDINHFNLKYDEVASSNFMNDLKDHFINIENIYNDLLNQGATAQEARMVLPNALKTEVCMKCNLREWRHFFKLRCSTAAHPDIRVLAIDLLKKFHEQVPVVFDDLFEEYGK